MPAKSKKQSNFMKLVYAYKKGALKQKDVGENVVKAAGSISEQAAKDFTKTAAEEKAKIKQLLMTVVFPIR